MRIDITDLKRREASFRLLFEGNPVPLLLFDAESHLGEHIEQIEKAKAALLQREGGAG